MGRPAATESTHLCVERMTNDPCGQITLPENQTCVASSCVYDKVTTGACVALRNGGETCGNASLAQCNRSLTCRDGMCTPTECP